MDAHLKLSRSISFNRSPLQLWFDEYININSNHTGIVELVEGSNNIATRMEETFQSIVCNKILCGFLVLYLINCYQLREGTSKN